MPSITDLKHAITLTEQIEALKAELSAVLGEYSSSGSTATTGKKRGRPALSIETSEAKPKRKKRKLSPEALEKIRAGQKKRWVKFHKENKTSKD